MSKTNHLPLFGVGPVIVLGQFIFTIVSIILTCKIDYKFSTANVLNLLFRVIGILLIAFGMYLDVSGLFL